MTCPRCNENLKILLEYVKKISIKEYDYFNNKYYREVEKGNWIIEKTQEIYCGNKGIYVVNHSGELNHTLELLNISMGQYIYKKEFLIESESYNYKLLPCLYHLTKEERHKFITESRGLINNKNDLIKEMFLELRRQYGMIEACKIISDKLEHKKTWKTVRRIVYSR